MSTPASVPRRWLAISLYAVGGIFIGVIVAAAFLVRQFQPIARDYFVSTLQKRYQSDVELGRLQISLYPTVRATGEGLVFRLHGRRDEPPMLQIRRFRLEAGFINFFRNPKHINRLVLEGLQIHLVRHSGEPAAIQSPGNGSPEKSDGAFVLDEVIADGSTLEIAPRDPSKDPLIFEIRQLTLHTVGTGQAMTYHAELNNPKPPGFIHSDGKFGPWNADRPVDTPIAGKYTFRDADLSVFKGITGTLSSVGEFQGHLDRLEVRGTTDTPDFALTLARHGMPLHTDFQATVDGTDGDTVLHPVHARLERSEFDVSGSIERDTAQARKTILLDAKTGGGRLEDFLRLTVRSATPPMTGSIRFTTKVKIPPGPGDVVEKMQLDGTFGLGGVKFTSPDVQGKIAGLSHRAQGDPTDHDPGVTAEFQGVFHLRGGQLALPDLRFSLPGANVSLNGTYGLRSGALDFKGTAKLDATVSQMTTGFKSKLLKPIDPLFRRDGAGTVLPVAISGTQGEPSFRLDIGRVLRRN